MCQRDEESRRREEDTGRDRDGREMEGHLRYRELGPPNSSGFQGNGDGGTPGMAPIPGTAQSSNRPPTPGPPLQCPIDTLNFEPWRVELSVAPTPPTSAEFPLLTPWFCQ